MDAMVMMVVVGVLMVVVGNGNTGVGMEMLEWRQAAAIVFRTSCPSTKLCSQQLFGEEELNLLGAKTKNVKSLPKPVPPPYQIRCTLPPQIQFMAFA